MTLKLEKLIERQMQYGRHVFKNTTHYHWVELAQETVKKTLRSKVRLHQCIIYPGSELNPGPTLS